MGRMVKFVEDQRKNEVKKSVTNFMGGTSYEYSPIETLKMVTASSIFGEPSYYRDGAFVSNKVSDGLCDLFTDFSSYNILPTCFNGMSTSAVMEEVIDAALDYDFKQTLDWAVTLRTTFDMRLNPQIIMVRAAIHPKRKAFNEANKGYFSEIQSAIMRRADEPASQLAYYLYKSGSKNKVPSILKRTWAHNLESASRYSLHKYKNAGIGMIDTVRICHAHSGDIDELMRTGNVSVSEENDTWEHMRSCGAKWSDIISTVNMGHMALLRNLRNIFSEIDDEDITKVVLEKLENGVLSGKQFPFRYYTAYMIIRSDTRVNNKKLILSSLERCVTIAAKNMPVLKGRTVCLSDNSGSAWGTFNSEFGSVKVGDIDNLSAVITAYNSDEGYVCVFGDKYTLIKIDKTKGILEQTLQIGGYNTGPASEVGRSTEGGIWKFLSHAISTKDRYDNIFIFSDMQAGHGTLYGTDSDFYAYRHFKIDGEFIDFSINRNNIDVAQLIDKYRDIVNPKVNVFSVQTAGYTNIVLPEYGYRTNLLYGWTGKESLFAKAMIDIWDSIDADRN